MTPPMPDQPIPIDNYAAKQEAHDRELRDKMANFIDVFNGEVVPKAALDDAIAKLAEVEDDLAKERNLSALVQENCDRVTRERDEARARLQRLPANWMEDSSLETWFPITAKYLMELRATVEALRGERDALRLAFADASHSAGPTTVHVEELTEQLQMRDNEIKCQREANVALRAQLTAQTAALAEAQTATARITTKCGVLHEHIEALRIVQAADMAKVEEERDEVSVKYRLAATFQKHAEDTLAFTLIELDTAQAEVARLSALVDGKDAALRQLANNVRACLGTTGLRNYTNIDRYTKEALDSSAAQKVSSATPSATA